MASSSPLLKGNRRAQRLLVGRGGSAVELPQMVVGHAALGPAAASTPSAHCTLGVHDDEIRR